MSVSAKERRFGSAHRSAQSIAARGRAFALSLGGVGLVLSACRQETGEPAAAKSTLPTAAPAAPSAVGAYATVGAVPKATALPTASTEPPLPFAPDDAGVPIQERLPPGVPL